MRCFDVLVVGAGPAGSTAALRLAQRGLRVALVEKAAFPRRKVCGEFISAGTWNLLEAMDIGSDLAKVAGPEIERVGLFARDVALEAPMPRSRGAASRGRAVGRHHLDTWLRDAAVRAGAEPMQPACVRSLERGDAGLEALVEGADGASERMAARFVVDAHGSWERDPRGAAKRPARDSDLLGFKARLLGTRLPEGLMPLVLFPGGYGGAVHTGSQAVSFSCCIRRDVLARIRHGEASAGEAVFAHVARHCRAVRESLGGSQPEGAWLAAGPIHPGIRPAYADGVFAVGNAAGEAHPLIADGISMAIQSAWLLAEAIGDGPGYARAWRRQFSFRVRASQAFAALTAAPATAAMSIELLRRWPALLTLGAAWGGKA